MFVSAYFTVTFMLLTHMSATISYKPDSNCEGTTAQRSNETWQMWLRRESEAEGEYLKPCWSWSWRTCSSPAFKTVSEYSKCIQLLLWPCREDDNSFLLCDHLNSAPQSVLLLSDLLHSVHSCLMLLRPLQQPLLLLLLLQDDHTVSEQTSSLSFILTLMSVYRNRKSLFVLSNLINSLIINQTTKIKSWRWSLPECWVSRGASESPDR